MRIQLKSKDEIRLMREAGLVAAEILEEVCAAAKPGASTWDLDRIARAGIDKHKVKSAFLGYGGYDLGALSRSLVEVLDVLDGGAHEAAGAGAVAPSDDGRAAVDRTLAAHGGQPWARAAASASPQGR